MGSYSVLHLVPQADGDFIPSPEAILQVIRHIGGARLWTFSAYARDLDWRDEDNEDNPVLLKCDISVETAIGLYRMLCQEKHTKYSYGIMSVSGNQWVMDLSDSFASFPNTANCRGDFVTGDITFEIGRVHVPAVDFETDQVICSFNMALSGSGMPIDIPRFLEGVRRNEMLVGLLDYMHSVAGIEFDILMSAYY